MDIVTVEDPEDVDVVHPLVEAVEVVDPENVGIPDVLATGLLDDTEDGEGTVEGVTADETVATGVVVKAADDVGYEDGETSEEGVGPDVGLEVGLDDIDGTEVGVKTAEGVGLDVVDGTEVVDGTVEAVTPAERVAIGVLVKAAEDVGFIDGVVTAEDVGFEVVDGAAVGVAIELTDPTDETDADAVDVAVADEDEVAELL